MHTTPKQPTCYTCTFIPQCAEPTITPGICLSHTGGAQRRYHLGYPGCTVPLEPLSARALDDLAGVGQQLLLQETAWWDPHTQEVVVGRGDKDNRILVLLQFSGKSAYRPGELTGAWHLERDGWHDGVLRTWGDWPPCGVEILAEREGYPDKAFILRMAPNAAFRYAPNEVVVINQRRRGQHGLKVTKSPF